MAQPTIPNLKRRIADGLTGWLTFEFACERGYLFSEHYLSHAVGQLLRSVCDTVRAEVPHPTLALNGGTGRPASIDFVAYKSPTTPVVAIETKWAGNTDITVGALAWDAFRLEAFSKSTGVPGLLVFAGTRARVERLFDSIPFRRSTSDSPPTPLFPLPGHPNRLTLSVSELSASASKFVRQKMSNRPKSAISDRLRCGLPTTGQHNGPKAISFSVLLWEINSGA